MRGHGGFRRLYIVYDQKGGHGPNYKQLLRPKGFEPVADKEPLTDLKKGVTSELHFKDTFWQLCGG